MLRGIRWVGLLALLALVLPALAADEKKSDKKPAAAAARKGDAREKDKYVSFGRPVIGQVVSVDERTIKIMIREVVRTARGPMPREREVEYEAVETVKVRLEALPPRTDDDGKPVKYTKEEMKQLKGAGNPWGYAGKLEDVEAGRVVRVFLGKVRGAGKEDPAVITMIHIAKPVGEDPALMAFGSGPAAGDAKKPAKDGESGDDTFVPVGKPFLAMFNKVENDTTVHLIIRDVQVNNGKPELANKNVSFEAGESLVIRTELPPPQVDDAGKLKKYTKEELAEFKGDDEKEWGYTGTWENLQPGRIVRVFLGKARTAEAADAPVILKLHVAMEPGDLKVDPAELVFVDRKKKGARDDEEAEKREKPKEESKPAPFGRPFIARVGRVDNGTRIAFTIRERYLNGTKVEFRDKSVEYNVYEGVRVRFEEPPLMFDGKGDVKKYTPEELKTLKGPEGLWGYPADMESVQPGRTVKVFLGKPDQKEDAVVTMILIAKPPT
jgi:hypothetical protein